MNISDDDFKRILDALEWYADPAHHVKNVWREVPTPGYDASKMSVLVSATEMDEGEIAREVLEKHRRAAGAKVIPIRRKPRD